MAYLFARFPSILRAIVVPFIMRVCTPLYYDYQGKLYVDSNNGGHGFAFDWKYDTIKITNLTDNAITATIDRTLSGEFDETSTIKLEKSNGRWLIANDFIDKTHTNNQAAAPAVLSAVSSIRVRAGC